MSEWTKTIAFVAAAVGIGAVSVAVHYATLPRQATVEDRVGKPLFPSLDAEQVRSLEIVARDPDSQALRRFKVENRDGVWRIPSHHDYPAEAAKRLFETATALYGLDRLALAGRWNEDQKRFGVIAPDSDDADSADPTELGKRIILRDANDEILADLVVGNPADVDETTSRNDALEPSSAAKKLFFVRCGDESDTYVANLNVDLSTRFSDWIEPDLLQVDPPEINKVVIDNYELQVRDELTNRGTVRRIGKLNKDRHELTREKPFDPWNLKGMDPGKEELNSQNFSKILNLLDNMVIAGVRPKTTLDGKPLLNPDLTVNTDLEAYRKDPAAFQQAILNLQTELMSYGFNVVPGNGQDEKPAFYSNRGELAVTTNDGLAYNLYFGDAVQGDETAIEVGGPVAGAPDNAGSQPNAPSGEAAQNEAAASAATPNGADSNKSAEAPGAKKNRYLMVRVSFDPTALGPEPMEPAAPQEPVKPEGYVAAAPPAEPASPTSADAPPVQPQDNRDPAFVKYDEQLAEFKTAQQKYQMDSDQYKRDLEDFKNRRAEGERKSKRLNDRFGPWFYVISADDLELLQIPRSDLVRPKPANEEKPGEIPTPPRPLPDRPDISV